MGKSGKDDAVILLMRICRAKVMPNPGGGWAAPGQVTEGVFPDQVRARRASSSALTSA